jgi:hypothetical protein
MIETAYLKGDICRDLLRKRITPIQQIRSLHGHAETLLDTSAGTRNTAT